MLGLQNQNQVLVVQGAAATAALAFAAEAALLALAGRATRRSGRPAGVLPPERGAANLDA